MADIHWLGTSDVDRAYLEHVEALRLQMMQTGMSAVTATEALVTASHAMKRLRLSPTPQRAAEHKRPIRRITFED